MNRWKIAALVVCFFGVTPWVRSEPEKMASKYDLYSWKDGNVWAFSLVPATKIRRVDAEIKLAGGPLRGMNKVKEKLIDMQEGDRVSWQQRAASGFVYPPDFVIEEIDDYAKSMGVKVSVSR